MGILKDHISIISFLKPGIIKVYSKSEENKYFVEDGIVEFKDNNLSILTSSIYNMSDLDRNKIDQIDLNFTYNFDQKIAALNDIKIDNKINQNVNKILSNIIIKKDDLQNKIYFKNLLNEAIKIYAG